jgi:hypothetical protein
VFKHILGFGSDEEEIKGERDDSDAEIEVADG